MSFNNFEKISEYEETLEKESGLDRWFKEKWVDVSRKDKSGKHPPCGRKDSDKGKHPKCRPSKRVSSKTPKTTKEMSSSEKKKSVKDKRKAEKKRSKPAGGGARKPKRAPSIKRKKKKSSFNAKLIKAAKWLESQGLHKEARELLELNGLCESIVRLASEEYSVGKRVFVKTMHYGNLPATIVEVKKSGLYGYDSYKVEFDKSMPPRARNFPLKGQSKWYGQNSIAILNQDGQLEFDTAWHDQTAGYQVSEYWNKNGLKMGWTKAYKELHNMDYTWVAYLASDIVGLLPFVGTTFDMASTLGYWEQWNKSRVQIMGIEQYMKKTPEVQERYRNLVFSSISYYVGIVTGLLSIMLEAVSILSAASTAGASLVVTTFPFVGLEALLKSYKWTLMATGVSATMAGGVYEAVSDALSKIKEFWESKFKFAVIDNENKEVKHAEGTMDEFLGGDFSKILSIVSAIELRDLNPYINELYAIHGYHADKVKESKTNDLYTLRYDLNEVQESREEGDSA